MKPRKYDYLLILQGNYGYGWEDLTAEDLHEPGARARLKANYKDYRDNEPNTALRIIERRELKKAAQ